MPKKLIADIYTGYTEQNIINVAPPAPQQTADETAEAPEEAAV